MNSFPLCYHRDLGPGCSVTVEGKLVPSHGQGQSLEVQASNVQVLGPCDNEVNNIMFRNEIK